MHAEPDRLLDLFYEGHRHEAGSYVIMYAGDTSPCTAFIPAWAIPTRMAYHPSSIIHLPSFESNGSSYHFSRRRASMKKTRRKDGRYEQMRRAADTWHLWRAQLPKCAAF